MEKERERVESLVMNIHVIFAILYEDATQFQSRRSVNR